jgi:hypothetical protein
MMSHASVPFAEPLPDGLQRIWFSPRDDANRSYVGWLIIDLTRPDQIIDLASTPVLQPGAKGTFDDCGAMMSWLVDRADRRLLYYIGWNTRATVPFHVSIGLAEGPAGPGLSDLRPRAGPILDRTLSDPLFCSNPCVLIDGDRYRMWYLSGLDWRATAGTYSASYHICHAWSDDGVCWVDRGRVVLPLEGDEFAIARPSVLRQGAGYRMWFCARTQQRAYRIGSALSADGLHWERDPSGQLPPNESGWDADMTAYPHVFEHAGARWMLYCGNGFGRSGFGLAVWE